MKKPKNFVTKYIICEYELEEGDGCNCPENVMCDGVCIKKVKEPK